MEAFGDTIFSGTVDIGATVFVPLLAKSYQEAYGNIYPTGAPTDVFTPTYATGIDTLLPTTLTEAQLLDPVTGKLPQTALFDIAPSGPFAGLPVPAAPSFGFGTSYLVTDAARAAYLADAAPTANPDGALLPGGSGLPAATPASPLRQALKANDLRLSGVAGVPAWLPTSPMLLCAGGNDTVVFSINTLIMEEYFGTVAHNLGTSAVPVVFNVDVTPDAQAPLDGKLPPAQDITHLIFGTLQGAFAQALAAQGGIASPTALQAYHGTVAPICTAASAAFFLSPSTYQ